MVRYIKSDLEFILDQILISEQHAAGGDLTEILPNQHVSFGLRTVTGELNNLVVAQSEFGAADAVFPRLTTPLFRTAEFGTSYLQTAVDPNANPQTNPVAAGVVIDSQPRTISNLIVDQTITNPAAVQSFVDASLGVVVGGVLFHLNDDGTQGPQVQPGETLTIPNTTPDEGLSAGFNSWFTFFGQFFDHGLDLVTKGQSGIVFIPLQQDDPLFVAGSPTNFMVLNRATNLPGPDGQIGTADDIHEHTNTTSPFVDQNQTYSSHPSHQVFLRAYELVAGQPLDTGKLIENRDLGADGAFGGTGLDADTPIGGMATWAVLKAQARDILGINLTDADVTNIPLLATDAYGNFIRGANGLPQVVVDLGNGTTILVPGSLASPLDLANPIPGNPNAFVVRTGHAFLDDIAHAANPRNSIGGLRTADSNTTAGDHFSQTGDDGRDMGNNQVGSGSVNYDNELLDAHYVAGDGRVNENIGLTAVHSVFHAEHNRLVEHTKEVVLASADLAFLNQWLLVPVAALPANQAEIDALQWNGQRLFQSAKFGTEMQYQHLVFEEFARKVQPNVDEFLAPEGYDATINAAITAEFAHTVYRFGHSLLLETVDRLDPNFASSEIGLIEAFLNPLAFASTAPTPEQATGAIVRGVTRQAGNELDEFVTEALRNNLLGLPLDLATINISRGRDTGIAPLNSARQTFFDTTGDVQLRPYTSWADYMMHLRHPESLINFIAAYGTHSTITGTMAERRAAATLLVVGDFDLDGNGSIDANEVAPGDRFDFLNATGAYAGGSLGGLNNVDFWIGGLAEAQMPFGGLLGSSFNFVFETQMEALQNGDRFYYLARTAGLNFLNELENNSFAKLIMRNSDVVHLPSDVFTTPAFTLEVNRALQHTGLDDPLDLDGIAGNSDPTGGLVINGVEVRALVERDDPGTAGPDTNYLRYNGEDHVVLGGTDGNDTIISSIGDDTLWGDGGNDRLEGGDGVDVIEGGDGNDIITDLGGDDTLRGNDGDDVIHGGNGFNLLLGGAGSDFIITGEDVSDTFGGTGNDFILGVPTNLPTLGNEGDDWIEVGTQDGAGGDNFDPEEDGTIPGHDVFITGSLFDEVDGEGGDDIMVGSDGPDHFGGGGGYDFASYENDPRGTTIDLNVNDFVEPPVAGSASGILDRFAQVEGLSGTNFADVLRGDDADSAEITAGGGAQDSTLNAAGIARIAGLQGLLNTALGATVTSFNAGNIILGGAGSDLIEGRGGDDVIDGDRRFNVRIEVTGTLNPETGNPFSFESMSDPLLLQNMLNGVWSPGQLQIVREILPGSPAFDTAMFSSSLQSVQTFRDTVNNVDVDLLVDNYSITTAGGVTTVRHLVYERTLDANGNPVARTDVVGDDGEDRLVNVERLQFGDQSVTLPGGIGLNNDPAGSLTITDPTGGAPAVNEVLTVSAAGITDADNPGGAVTGPFAYYWQSEAVPGSGVFQDILTLDGDRFTREQAGTLTVSPDLDGLRLRVRAVYQDANGTLENVFSAPTLPVAGSVAPPAPPVIPQESATTTDGFHMIRSDLQFILEQIRIAERDAAGENLADIVPNSRLPFGLRTVDGTFNNIVPGQEGFGAADENFRLLLEQNFRNDQDGDAIAFGPPPAPVLTNTNYALTGANGDVVDADPRIISNLIADQTITNPAAVEAFVAAGFGTRVLDINGNQVYNADGTPQILDADGVLIPRGQTLGITNTAPDEGLSASFNSWFTFFGQFFDHGLDLVNKGGEGIVYVPLMPDDPLITHGPDGIAGTGDEVTNPGLQFMAVTRATNTVILPGADLTLGTADDVHLHNNQTTPFVDQNQTYTSHPSHQVFLREYTLDAANRPVATGKLLDGFNPSDGSRGGLPTWAQIKDQALMLGVRLTDADVVNLPFVRVDAYGNFIPDPATGMAQVIVGAGADLLLNTEDDDVVVGSPAVPVDTFAVGAVRTNHAFLDDIAHTAAPVGDHDRNPGTPAVVFTADTDGVINGDLNGDGDVTDPGETPLVPGIDLNLDGDVRDIATGLDEVLYNADIDGDGNIAGVTNGVFENFLGVDLNDDGDTTDVLAAVTEKFYDDELLDRHFVTGDGRGNENIALTSVHHVFHSEHNRLVEHIKDVILASNDPAFIAEWQTSPGVWDGERLFQAARFGTEMQYQHLVFEEFARKVQPQVDIFLGEGQGYDTTINPAIVAEFAHTVYRFGHTMLTETIDRFDPNYVSNDIGLVQAFLNPLAFNGDNTVDAEAAAGAVIRGMTRQAGNEIDEFVTEALRNNLLGLPLDLPTINITRGRDTGVPSLNAARTEFFAMTGDAQLRPYTSWSDYMINLRHPESVINFIAAYGTHSSITGATTLADKRAAATLLVLGDFDLDHNGAIDPNELAPADRLDFLNALGAYTDRGGLDTVDFWIGGLAERQMPFGGLLGSSFNFVFENQLENLQNGDRFYYLERTAGLNMLTELENNSFARLIMANTDTTHLPGDVFSTPAFTIEVDRSRQHTGLDDPLDPDLIPGNSDPTGGIAVLGVEVSALVIRDNPATAGPDSNYLQYTGVDHVVLGGTNPGNPSNPSGDDIIISSIGDDTLYGDAGNDRLDGGDGVDMTLGGAGDDIITDLGGEDNLQGGDGNDAIHGGNSIDLILGGFGQDFIVTGEDGDESFGGVGNDFFLGDPADEAVFGNEGDDWLEGGTADGGAGDSFDVRGLDQIIGNDVFMGDTVADRMFGEGGDDIMIGNGGFGDRYLGASGFDWASYQGDRAATADMSIRAFDFTPLPQSPVTVLPRFDAVEGMSGSTRSDILRGDDRTAAQIAVSGGYGSVLNNIALINGLQQYLDAVLGAPVTSFGDGNIMLGSAGGDLLEGGGGNDLIDGDRSLNVRIHVDTDNNGIEDIGEISVTSLTEIDEEVFAGLINPGDLRIVREILPGDGNFNFDTAVFSGLRSEYEIFVNGVLQPIGTLFSILATDVVTVAHRLVDAGAIIPGSVGADGIDRLTGIERLQFNDAKEVLAPGLNNEPEGLLTLSDSTPNIGTIVTVSAANLLDLDNVSPTNATGAVLPPITYIWQVELRPGSGVFTDIIIDTGLAGVRVIGDSLEVTPDLAGLRLRVRGIYEDANGTLETVFSAPSLPAGGPNAAPTDITLSGASAADELSVEEHTDGLIGVFATIDADDVDFTYEIIGGTGAALFTLGPDGDEIVVANQVVLDLERDGPGPYTLDVRSTDPGGLSVTNTFTITVTDAAPDLVFGTALADEIHGGASSGDNLRGLGGDDLLIGGDGNDRLDGGADNDTLQGGNGNDTLIGNLGNDLALGGAGADRLIGNEGDDTLLGEGDNDNIDAGSGNDTIDGGSGDDAINGRAGADSIVGGLGNDSINGEVGDDLINAGDGDDFVRGGTGLDFIAAGAGADIVLGEADNDRIEGDAGNDFIDGGAGNDRLFGGADNDVITGNAGLDFIDGGAGEDVLNGGADANTVFGGSGGDVITGGDGADTLFGQDGNDGINGGAGANFIDGGAGDDQLVGGGDSDIVAGGSGLDFLDGGAGNDVLSGGGDNDTVQGGAGVDVLNGEAGDDILLSEAGDDGILGGDGADFIDGGADNDTMQGEAGNDVIAGAAGNDIILGGDGDDTVNGGVGDDYAEGGAGNDVMRGDVGADILLAGDGIDFVEGGDGNDFIDGGTGNDMLFGEAGTDSIMAGGGDDLLMGGAGGDFLNGGIGNDVSVYEGTSGDYTWMNVGVGIYAVTETATGTTDVLFDIERLRFTGTPGDIIL